MTCNFAYATASSSVACARCQDRSVGSPHPSGLRKDSLARGVLPPSRASSTTAGCTQSGRGIQAVGTSLHGGLGVSPPNVSRSRFTTRLACPELSLTRTVTWSGRCRLDCRPAGDLGPPLTLSLQSTGSRRLWPPHSRQRLWRRPHRTDDRSGCGLFFSRPWALSVVAAPVRQRLRESGLGYGRSHSPGLRVMTLANA
jgi:hypothetical protein